jgi:hypothetical protein
MLAVPGPVLVVSPHMDDGVLSCDELIAQTGPEINDLVAGYTGGSTVYELADRFGVNESSHRVGDPGATRGISPAPEALA